eukprot:gene11867-24866_t
MKKLIETIEKIEGKIEKYDKDIDDCFKVLNSINDGETAKIKREQVTRKRLLYLREEKNKLHDEKMILLNNLYPEFPRGGIAAAEPAVPEPAVPEPAVPEPAVPEPARKSSGGKYIIRISTHMSTPLHVFQVDSYNELLLDIGDHFSDFAFSPFTLIGADGEKIENLDGIDQNCILTVKAADKSVGFSDFTETSAFEYAKLFPGTQIAEAKEHFSCLSSDIVAGEEFVTLVAHVVKDLQYKSRAVDYLNECSMRQFMDATLVSAVILMDIDVKLKLACEKKIIGTRGNGPVDYAFVYKFYSIVLTEAKRNDIDSAVKQNLAQQVASREEYVKQITIECNGRKRKYEDNMEGLKDIPSFGIVTSGEAWMLLKYYFDDVHKNWKLVKSPEFLLSFKAAGISDAILSSQVSELLSKICRMLQDQMVLVDDFNRGKRQRRPETISSTASSVPINLGGSWVRGQWWASGLCLGGGALCGCQ